MRVSRRSAWVITLAILLAAWMMTTGRCGEAVLRHVVIQVAVDHDHGGSVAMARQYRRFFADLGLHKTLREKAADNPAVQGLAGTTFFWACGSRPEHAREIANLLVSCGIDRCQLAMCNTPTRKDDSASMQEMAASIRHIRSLGYHVYRYDQYRDSFEPNPAKSHSHQINLEAWS
jgi:hypothetical protein